MAANVEAPVTKAVQSAQAADLPYCQYFHCGRAEVLETNEVIRE